MINLSFVDMYRCVFTVFIRLAESLEAHCDTYTVVKSFAIIRILRNLSNYLSLQITVYLYLITRAINWHDIQRQSHFPSADRCQRIRI